jgi:hypothetical protein
LKEEGNIDKTRLPPKARRKRGEQQHRRGKLPEEEEAIFFSTHSR